MASMWARVKTFLGGKQTLTTLASVATLNVPDDDNGYFISGSATITSLTVAPYLRNRQVTFIGAASASVTFTNTTDSTTAGQMDLGGENIVLSAKDIVTLFCDQNGVWQLVSIRYNNAVSTSVASATTTTVPAVGSFFVITGTATITTLTAATTGKIREVTFIGGASAAAIFTNTESPAAGQMYLRGGDIVLREQYVLTLVLQTDGSWYLKSTTSA